MKALFLAIAIFVFALASHAASFDCTKASTLVEKTICKEPQLSDLDDLLMQSYKIAMANTKDADTLKSQQKAWLTNVRNKCLDSVCLMRVYNERLTVLNSISALSASTVKYPWMVKPQTELTKAECTAAMQHDRNYWWARSKCHMMYIRYAWGVAIRDVAAKESSSSMLKKGELLQAITQYRPDEGTYCEHGGYCYPAKDIKLLGSILTGAYNAGYKAGDETDLWQGVSTSCELILADRKNIIAANAHDMLKDCH